MGLKDKLKEESENKRKSKLKKAVIAKLIPIVAGILGIIIIGMSVYSIIMTVQDGIASLLSSAGATISNFFKWLNDDYWIKLDKEIDSSSIDPNTRRTIQNQFGR